MNLSAEISTYTGAVIPNHCTLIKDYLEKTKSLDSDSIVPEWKYLIHEEYYYYCKFADDIDNIISIAYDDYITIFYINDYIHPANTELSSRSYAALVFKVALETAKHSNKWIYKKDHFKKF